ncbi:TrbG/VirB9 family P-type conjugative transfer protein [Propionispira raffinosivorans]|uniref:TrbG/VirB9 family P-type conjugative transfer protein n=1 Tax=Propionispira raffinosivorans TaxID=86959 RepID=UPI000377E2E0|nr:TrbG/VirB9 family P-type conjugative transfer protein [Propionispira raffinosivorans]
MNHRKIFIAFMVALSMYSSSLIALAEQKAFYATEDAYVSASKLLYDYNEGSVYQVYSELGHVTDIVLHQNEKLVGVLAGDTERWSIETAEVANIVHVYVKPKFADISTNFIINTDKRSYRLLVSSTDTYNPVIAWDYPEEMYRKVASAAVYKNREEKTFLDIFTEKIGDRYVAKTMNYFYETKGSKKANMALFPLKVFDDGTRTYIQMPKSNKYDLPVLYNVEDIDKEKLTLVNYRIHGAYFIADRVFMHARLHYSANVYVDIYPKKVESGLPKLFRGGDA